jgi:hypothetical protein
MKSTTIWDIVVKSDLLPACLAYLQYVPLKYQQTSTRLLKLTSQKILLFMVTAVQKSDLAEYKLYSHIWKY